MRDCRRTRKGEERKFDARSIIDDSAEFEEVLLRRRKPRKV
jgi:hypothetical protein